MKRMMALLLSAMMFAVLLTGCVSTDIGVKLNKNGTGSLTTTLGIEEEFYNNLCESGSDPFEGKETSAFERDGHKYISYAEATEYASYEDMEKALLDMTYNTDVYEGMEQPSAEEESDLTASENESPAEPVDNHIFKKVSIEKNSGLFYSTYTFSATLNPMASAVSGYKTNDLFALSMSVEMPSEISQVMGGTADGNKAVFEIQDITAETEYAVSSEVNQYGVIIGIVVVLMAIVAAFLIFTRKKG